MKDKAYIGDEIVEGNKLIAEFMGAKKSTVDNDGRYLRFPEPHAGTKTYAFYPNNLKYHSSWDWLMPVVDKLPEKHSYHFNDEQSEAVLVQLKDALFDADILKAWLTVVQFITWYNNQNKQS